MFIIGKGFHSRLLAQYQYDSENCRSVECSYHMYAYDHLKVLVELQDELSVPYLFCLFIRSIDSVFYG